MAALEKQLQRWQTGGLLDDATVERILRFEEERGKGRLRWPALLAVGFGVLMLSAGVLLFVSSHWDYLSPASRFSLVLAMVAVFHLAGAFLGLKTEMLGTALHTAGTVSLGAGIFLAGQIFNLQEHWPGGIMLWAFGAAAAWAVLRQWPQAFLTALLVPAWLTSEWIVRIVYYHNVGEATIAIQGLLLLAIVYISSPLSSGDNRPLNLSLVWTGSLALIPLTMMLVLFRGPGLRHETLPAFLGLAGYGVAYAPALGFVWLKRRNDARWVTALAIWIAVLAAVCRSSRLTDLARNPWLYLLLALGATLLCAWGVIGGRRLFINFGSAGFAITVIAFYFSNVFDKLGRSAGLISMGILFLLGGWVLNHLRARLIARAKGGGAQ